MRPYLPSSGETKREVLVQHRLRVLSPFVVVGALIAIAIAFMAAGNPATPTPVPPTHLGAFTVRLPESPHYHNEGDVLFIPQLIQAEPRLYAAHPLDQPVAHPSGQPVAQLRTLPAGTQALDTILTSPPAAKPGALQFQHLSSVRYTVGDHTVIVTTHRPTQAVTQKTLLLGKQTVHLADGSPAWLTTDQAPLYAGAPTTQLVLVHDDLLIAIASDLAPDQIEALAALVTVTP